MLRVPDAMFVAAPALELQRRVDAALQELHEARDDARRDRLSIGGERSMESSLRNCVTAGGCAFGSSEWTPSTSCCGGGLLLRLAAGRCSGPGMPPGSVAPAPGVVRMRRFCNCSCFLSLRIEIVVSLCLCELPPVHLGVAATAATTGRRRGMVGAL